MGARHRAARRAAAGPGCGPQARGGDLHPARRDRRDRAQRQGAARAEFQRLGHHPIIAACDNVAEPLAWMLRPSSAGSNTASDHLRLLGEAIAALPSALRQKLLVTCDGDGASYALVKELDWLAGRHGYQLTYSSAGSWARGRGPRSARSLRRHGSQRSTARARSASAAPMTPAAIRAARTASAG